MPKKVVLCIIDGFGVNDNISEGDAIKIAKTPFLDYLYKEYPNLLLNAHGCHVGLLKNQMGNSEVGHLTIGSGRVIPQPLVRIGKSILSNEFKQKVNFMVRSILNNQENADNYDKQENYLKNSNKDQKENNQPSVNLNEVITKKTFSKSKPELSENILEKIEAFYEKCSDSVLLEKSSKFPISEKNLHEHKKIHNLQGCTIVKKYKDEKIGFLNEQPIHIVGLFSNGGVHSHYKHILELINVLEFKNIFIHAITDGRDTHPFSATEFIVEFMKMQFPNKNVKLATIGGRFYGMDRDKNEDRIDTAIEVMIQNFKVKGYSYKNEEYLSIFSDIISYKEVSGENLYVQNNLCRQNTKIGSSKYPFFSRKYFEFFSTEELKEICENFCDFLTNDSKNIRKLCNFINLIQKRGVNDENFPPVCLFSEPVICKDEIVIFANFRSDRMKQIVNKIAMTNKCVTMTQCVDNPKVLSFFKQNKISNTLAEIISKNNLKQTHIAETEKYAHVTYFLNGYEEKPFKGEKRILIDSRKISCHSQFPAMRTIEISEAVIKEMKENTDFIVFNMAAPDMVGHTGDLEATICAIEVVDESLKRIYDASKSFEYTFFITSDHGNSEKMLDLSGNPCKTHTTNPVPFFICDKDIKFIREINKDKISLASVAPTICKYMGLEVDDEKNSFSLI